MYLFCHCSVPTCLFSIPGFCGTPCSTISLVSCFGSPPRLALPLVFVMLMFPRIPSPGFLSLGQSHYMTICPILAPVVTHAGDPQICLLLGGCVYPLPCVSHRFLKGRFTRLNLFSTVALPNSLSQVLWTARATHQPRLCLIPAAFFSLCIQLLKLTKSPVALMSSNWPLFSPFSFLKSLCFRFFPLGLNLSFYIFHLFFFGGVQDLLYTHHHLTITFIFFLLSVLIPV